MPSRGNLIWERVRCDEERDKSKRNREVTSHRHHDRLLRARILHHPIAIFAFAAEADGSCVAQTSVMFAGLARSAVRPASVVVSAALIGASGERQWQPPRDSSLTASSSAAVGSSSSSSSALELSRALARSWHQFAAAPACARCSGGEKEVCRHDDAFGMKGQRESSEGQRESSNHRRVGWTTNVLVPNHSNLVPSHCRRAPPVARPCDRSRSRKTTTTPRARGGDRYRPRYDVLLRRRVEGRRRRDHPQSGGRAHDAEVRPTAHRAPPSAAIRVPRGAARAMLRTVVVCVCRLCRTSSCARGADHASSTARPRRGEERAALACLVSR